MIKIQTLVLSAMLLLVSACSTCYDKRFVSAQAIGSSPGATFVSPTYAFDSAKFQISADVQLTIGPCGNQKLPWGSLCMRVVAPEGRLIRFSSRTFFVRYADQSGRDELHTLDVARYTVICEVTKGMRICSSSEILPTKASFNVTSRSFSNHDVTTEITEYSFDPTVQFRGALEKRGPRLSRLFVASENWREYIIPIFIFPVLESPEMILRMPGIFVDDVKFELPELRVSTMTTRYCPSGV